MLLRELNRTDRTALKSILLGITAFRTADVELALELIDDRLEKGARSDYQFVVGVEGKTILGYTCFGPIPLTDSSFDLYWIVVAQDGQRKGVGAKLLKRTTTDIIRQGGTKLYADTSSKIEYAQARAFYIRMGFVQVASLPDFYGKDNHKLIFCRELQRHQ